MKITIVDDHQMIAEAIKNSLLIKEVAKEVETFGSWDDFYGNQEKDKLPNVLITDLLMPGINGLELLKNYKNYFEEHAFDCKIIVLSTFSDSQTIKMALQNGANAFLSKESDIEELIECISACLSGKSYFSKKLHHNLMESFVTGEQIIYHLSPREKDVLQLVCSGKTIKEAASDMFLSVHTVKSYYKNIMKKFNVHRTSDLIVFAIKNGFYHPPSH